MQIQIPYCSWGVQFNFNLANVCVYMCVYFSSMIFFFQVNAIYVIRPLVWWEYFIFVFCNILVAETVKCFVLRILFSKNICAEIISF
jgi:hypothetical protein